MFKQTIDDFKESAGSAMRLAGLTLVAAFTGFVTIMFLCAAAFIFVLQNYGLIEACLSGAAIFFLITFIAVVTLLIRRKAAKKRAAQHAKAAAQNFLADPMVVSAGLQLVRAVGVKKLIPIVAIGGLALGLLVGGLNRDGGADVRKEN